MTQLLLSLETPPSFTFDNIVPHEGIASALDTIKSVYGTGKLPLPSLLIYGPAGTGKTHLLVALAGLLSEHFAAHGHSVQVLRPSGEPPRFPGLTEPAGTGEEGSFQISAVVLDDVHLMNEEDAAHLWTLFNKLTRQGAPLIASSRFSPERTFSDNPHLKSRVKAGLVFGLLPPPDNARIMILDKMARDRNVRISHDVAGYLVTRKSRNVKELERIFNILDTVSLQMKRRITLPLIKMLEKEGAI
jgi:DnaA-homolog protein